LLRSSNDVSRRAIFLSKGVETLAKAFLKGR
jgi:hypothetical protein